LAPPPEPPEIPLFFRLLMAGDSFCPAGELAAPSPEVGGPLPPRPLETWGKRDRGSTNLKAFKARPPNSEGSRGWF